MIVRLRPILYPSNSFVIMNGSKEKETQVEVRCVGFHPGNLLGYMDWDNPKYRYWAENTPRDLTYARYHRKYEFLYQKQQFDHGDIPKLFEAFILEDDEEFRNYVVICISRLKPTHEVYTDLLSRSHFGETMVRALSVRALGLFSNAEAVHELLSALDSNELIIVRSAAGALAHHPCPDVEKALLEKLNFEDQETVDEILDALQEVGTEVAERELLRLLENTEFFRCHEYNLLETLSTIAGPLTIESLPRLHSSGTIDDWTLSYYFRDILKNTHFNGDPKKRSSILRQWLADCLADFSKMAAVVIMVALYNTITWWMCLPGLLPLILIKDHQIDAKYWEPLFFDKGTVLLNGLACAVVGIYLGTPFARLALRSWPVDLFGGRNFRYWIILGLGCLSLIPVLLFFSISFVGFYNSAMHYLEPIPTLGYSVGEISSAIVRVEHERNLATVKLFWGSGILGSFCIFYWAHLRAKHYIGKPFVVFLRRFSSFADRSLVADIFKSMPENVPLAFIASRSDQVRNWDPFLWAFGGLRILHPLKNLPIQIKTTDKNWTETVKKLLQKAYGVVIDLSDRSPSVNFEMKLVAECVSRDRIIALVDKRRWTGWTDMRVTKLLGPVIRYSPSYRNSAVKIIFKIGSILAIWVLNEGFWSWLVLLLLPLMILPSVSRDERAEIRRAILSAIEFNTKQTVENECVHQQEEE